VQYYLFMKNSIRMSYFILFLGVICFSTFTEVSSQEVDPFMDYSWANRIRVDHPRLFFNKNTFPAMKERALNEEKDIFEEMKIRVDLLLGQKIEFPDPLAIDGQQNSNHAYGTRAAEAAFIYLVLEDKKYLDLCKNILVNLIDYYKLRNDNNLNIQWYAYSRISALAAYDWIHNDLTEKERNEIGYSLLHAINYMISPGKSDIFRRNNGGIQSGFYGPPCLPWYAGLVFYKKRIDDDLAEKLLRKGYDDHTSLLAFRSNIAGDSGGASSATLGYSLGAYPHTEFNFFHTFNSATGLDITEKWPYVPSLINYLLWNWLPGDKQFGYGDVAHTTNDLPLGSMHLHLSQMVHFYGRTHPELISLAKWMLPIIGKSGEGSIPVTRFLLTETHDEIKPKGPPESLRKARHFDNMGQIFMRSGSGPDDTYATFSAGGILTQHRHFDNNNFVIFKKGFLALDAGARPQPGLHLPYYFARTVAHNCITVKMPGEKMPWYWGGPSLGEEPAPPVPNDGGQNNRMGSEVIAFDENEHYVYIASDATESYHKDKAKLVLRQFVFLPPDHFVIFDRVSSTKPDYEKRWLLHTAAEPTVNAGEFYSDHWEGRLFCKTLLPENGVIKKIGGPGKQFWSDGRNWSMPVLQPGEWGYESRHHIPPDTLALLGQWRIEVYPGKPNIDDVFLHLIQVGDTSLESMVVSRRVDKDGMTGVFFVHENKEYEVMFSAKDETGGRITITQNGQVIIKEEFSKLVKRQTGWF
jgi:hypothetical protein